MKNERIIIATIKSWNISNAKKLRNQLKSKYNIFIFTKRKELSYKKVRKINPRYIFFPHWSWTIPKQIYENFECIVFHMTDLPFGRGGSPLQNLIERGIYKTKLTTIKVVKGIDAGPIYLKKALNLKGSASEIFQRVSGMIFKDIIPVVLNNMPIPFLQKGKIVNFQRRRPNQSNIANLNSISKIYDYIRMLDAEGYPLAFIKTPKLKIEFFNAKLKKQYVLTNAKIEVKK